MYFLGHFNGISQHNLMTLDYKIRTTVCGSKHFYHFFKTVFLNQALKSITKVACEPFSLETKFLLSYKCKGHNLKLH